MDKKKKPKTPITDTLAGLEKRIAALKAKVREKKGAPADGALRSLKKKLRRAQRRRRSLLAFARALEARRAGRKAPAESPAPAAPAAS